MDRLNQALPPLPEDPDMSNTRESHCPIVLGADIATAGEIANAELTMCTLICDEAEAQVVALHAVVGHFAFTVTLEDKCTTVPMLTQ